MGVLTKETFNIGIGAATLRAGPRAGSVCTGVGVHAGQLLCGERFDVAGWAKRISGAVVAHDAIA